MTAFLQPVARSFAGRILYRHDTGAEHGREAFTVSILTGGERTVRAMCEMDDERLLRDVVYTVDMAWRPLDAFVRLSREGQFVGSSWFHFGDRLLECEGMTAAGGRFHQAIEVARRPPVFAPHPLVCDGWQAAAVDHTRPERRQAPVGATNSSPAHDGGTGPMIGLTDKHIEFAGEGTRTVRAGTFAVRRYRIIPERQDWPPLDIEVTPRDLQLVRLRWDLLQSTYELAELNGAVG